jgi:hypothetical protein
VADARRARRVKRSPVTARRAIGPWILPQATDLRLRRGDIREVHRAPSTERRRRIDAGKGAGELSVVGLELRQRTVRLLSQGLVDGDGERVR